MELALSIGEPSRKRKPATTGFSRHGSSENPSHKQCSVHLDLLHSTPVTQLGLSLSPESRNNSERRSSGDMVSFDVSQVPSNRDDEPSLSSSRCSNKGRLTRKKLRLSKDQSVYLEECFKEHNTLNPKQKLAVAKGLNLEPRQVEVWFQNRRARTKLKQTELDCEYLKRCCQSLTEENQRLRKELQDLKSLRPPLSLYNVHVVRGCRCDGKHQK